jgi:hypothetical protein
MHQKSFVFKNKKVNGFLSPLFFAQQPLRSKIKTNSTANVKFRISIEPEGLVSYDNVNICFRTFFFADPNLISSFIDANNGKTFFTFVFPMLNGVNRAIKESLPIMNITNRQRQNAIKRLTPTRLVIYATKNQPFFSIAVGYSFPESLKKKAIYEAISYNISLAGFENNIFVLSTKSSKIHNCRGHWDDSHSRQKPLYNFDADFCNENFKNLIQTYFEKPVCKNIFEKTLREESVEKNQCFPPKSRTTSPILQSIEEYLNQTLNELPNYATKKTDVATIEKKFKTMNQTLLKKVLEVDLGINDSFSVNSDTASRAFLKDFDYWTAKTEKAIAKTAFLADVFDEVKRTKRNLTQTFVKKYDVLLYANSALERAATNKEEVAKNSILFKYKADYAEAEKEFLPLLENTDKEYFAHTVLLNTFETEAAFFANLVNKAVTSFVLTQERKTTTTLGRSVNDSEPFLKSNIKVPTKNVDTTSSVKEVPVVEVYEAPPIAPKSADVVPEDIIVEVHDVTTIASKAVNKKQTKSSQSVSTKKKATRQKQKKS